MKIRYKITLLTGVLLAISLSFIYVQYMAERSRTEELLAGVLEGQKAYFNSVVDLSSSDIAIYASDYGFWDEMVEFVKNPDAEFAAENLEPSVAVFHADEIFAYNIDAELVYGFELDRSPAIAPEIPREAFEVFRKDRLAHFYLYKEGRLTEYRLATVHPTIDPERVTEPQGFFLAGKLWNPEHIALLQERSNAVINLASEAPPHDELTVSFAYEVRSWNGEVTEVYTVDTPVPLAAAAFDASQRQLYLIAGSFLALLILVYVFLQRIVGRPIAILSDSIERKDYRLLSQMKGSRSEFGVLAQLILDFSEHEAVLEAKAKDDAILGAVGSGLIVVDVEGRIELVNAAAEKLLGVNAKEVMGVAAADVVKMETREGKAISMEEKPLARALRTRSVATAVVMCARADGTKFPAAVTAAPVLEGGEVIGAVQDFRDITEEEMLERAKGDFISLVSHELRTPLTALRWSVESLQKRTDLPTDVFTLVLSPMTSAINRMKALIATILDVSKAETDSFVTSACPVSLKTLVDKGLEDLAHTIQEKQLTVTRSFPNAMKDIITDERMLGIVVSSLITNAIRYSDKEGRITVSAREEETESTLAIANTGAGIPLDEQPQIFSKLFRATNARLLNPDGTGLGLYISKSFIERLGGSISFTSEPGKETTFTIRVPRTPKKG